jgi:hypothetical protein
MAPDSINRAPKLRQYTVACRVGYAASMRRNQPIQDFTARSEGIEGCDLIGPHEAAVALHVSCKNSSQPALRFNGLGQG